MRTATPRKHQKKSTRTQFIIASKGGPICPRAMTQSKALDIGCRYFRWDDTFALRANASPGLDALPPSSDPVKQHFNTGEQRHHPEHSIKDRAGLAQSPVP
uniref:Uncharacterized protein n=1 Tax=Eutreptiella gymnastica TaxID=73025 RepID=A0A6T2DXK7_9EUGL